MEEGSFQKCHFALTHDDVGKPYILVGFAELESSWDVLYKSRIWILKGAFEIGGARLRVGDTVVITVDQKSAIPVLKPLAATTGADSMPETVTDFPTLKETEFLKKHQFIIALRVLDDVAIKCQDYSVFLDPSAWQAVATQLLKTGDAHKRILISGSMGIGKSTFCQYLANTMLTSGFDPRCVCIMDIDPGQPLFGVPGTLSLRVFTDPIMTFWGSTCTVFDETVLGICYIGSLSPESVEEEYLNAVHRLMVLYERLCALQSSNDPSDNGIPLLVNTCGWVTGMGFQLLDGVAALSRATHLVAMSSGVKASAAARLEIKRLQGISHPFQKLFAQLGVCVPLPYINNVEYILLEPALSADVVARQAENAVARKRFRLRRMAIHLFDQKSLKAKKLIEDCKAKVKSYPLKYFNLRTEDASVCESQTVSKAVFEGNLIAVLDSSNFFLCYAILITIDFHSNRVNFYLPAHVTGTFSPNIQNRYTIKPASRRLRLTAEQIVEHMSTLQEAHKPTKEKKTKDPYKVVRNKTEKTQHTPKHPLAVRTIHYHNRHTRSVQK